MAVDDRLNHRASRRRDGRSQHERRPRDHLGYAKRMMDIWSEWTRNYEEHGWPSESLEARAMRLAAGKTEVGRDARYTGKVVIDDDGRTVAKDPPPMPKETRSTPPARVPRIDQSRIGPNIDRAIRDLEEQGGRLEAKVLRLHHLAPSLSAEARADSLGVSVRTYWNRYACAIAWLAGRLSAS